MASKPSKPLVVKKSPAPKRKFAFELTKPIMTGYMLKQGGFHKAFKQRFFVLYPGFLVYYDQPEKWKYDLQRGETLGSRLGAVKLRGGSVEKSKSAPRAAKYAFTVYSPDKSNHRSDYTFNCQSNEERYQWMSRIASAIPSAGGKSPKTERKDDKETPAADDSRPTSASPPAERQETVDEAALLASSNTHEEEDETHIDDILGPATERDEEDGSSDSGASTPDKEPGEVDKEDVVVSSAKVEVNGKKETEQEEEKKEEKDEQKKEEEEEEEEDESSTILTIKEVVLKPEEKSQFLISVIDPSLLAPSDEESSEEDEEKSNSSSPPPETIDTTSPPPSITIDKGTLERQPSADTSSASEGKRGSESGSSSPDLRPSTPDKRRPTGAASFIDKRGYLYKMGGHVKSWKLRYFILQPGVFRYYKNDPNGKPLGEVKLKNVNISFPLEAEKKFSSYQFNVHTESTWNKRQDWGMAAANEKDLKEWVEAFKLAGGAIMHVSLQRNGSE